MPLEMSPIHTSQWHFAACTVEVVIHSQPFVRHGQLFPFPKCDDAYAQDHSRCSLCQIAQTRCHKLAVVQTDRAPPDHGSPSPRDTGLWRGGTSSRHSLVATEGLCAVAAVCSESLLIVISGCLGMKPKAKCRNSISG